MLQVAQFMDMLKSTTKNSNSTLNLSALIGSLSSTQFHETGPCPSFVIQYYKYKLSEGLCVWLLVSKS